MSPSPFEFPGAEPQDTSEKKPPENPPAAEMFKQAALKAHGELKKPMPEMSRRGFLGALTASAIIGTQLDSLFAEGTGSQGEKLKEPEAFPTQQVERTPGESAVYDMGPLAGRKVGGLFALYLGVPDGSEVPEKLQINFDESLNSLWAQKENRVARRLPASLSNVQKARRQYQEMYRNRKEDSAKSIKELVKEADAVVGRLYEAIDWERLSSLKSIETNFTALTPEDVELVKKMALTLSGKMLVAYSITELMPALKDAEMNVNMYEFLAVNAGVEFLCAIPAVYDNKLSVGPLQFTEYAVYDMGGKNKRGASVINELLPEAEQINGSVITLTSMEHNFKAGYLFAIYNIARLVKRLRQTNNIRARVMLQEQIDQRPIALLQYIASAHNNPNDAMNAFSGWVEKGFQGSHAKRARFTEGYIRKSNVNLKELDRRI